MHYHIVTRYPSGHVSDSGPCTTRRTAEDVIRLSRLTVQHSSAYLSRTQAHIEACENAVCLMNEAARNAEEDADYAATAHMTDDEAGVYFERRLAALNYDVGER